jgi:L,D-peptidoglycan transpeptidase YkuD (ErfK/YbiS/YcfS/YnhG family)
MRRTTTAGALAVLMTALLLPVTAAVAVPAPTVAPTTTSAAVRHVAVPSALPAATPALAFAPGIPGARRYSGTIPATTRQVIVVSAASWRSTVATLTLYSRAGTGWHRVATWPARLGYSGLVIGTQRKQDTGKTPAGSYAITQAFGRQANPGTSVPYTKVTDAHWWVEDRRSAYYNTMRLGSQGGFALRTSGYNSSEHLARMGSQYDYAAVIDFNRPKPVVGRGAGIFLHAYGTGATAGCVAVQYAHMRQALQWLRGSAQPRIIIGTRAWLAG